MQYQYLLDIVLGLALVAWISYRQMVWRPVNIPGMWRMPAILAVAGIFFLIQNGHGVRVNTLDIVFIAAEVVLSLIVGSVMGRIAVFRPLAHPVEQSRGGVSTLESRTGWVGLVLWVALIAIRVGLDVVAADLGATLLASTGLTLLMVAANRAARTAVFAYRIDRHLALAARA